MEASASRRDPYDPKVLEDLSLYSEQKQPAFVHEVTEVGMVYPPPSIPFFAAMGVVPRPWRPLVWFVVISAPFLLAVYLLARLLNPRPEPRVLLGAALLVFSSQGVMSTILHGQTIGILLCLVLAAWLARRSHRAGIWSGLAMVLKPIGAIALAPAFSSGRLRTFSSALLVFGAAWILAAWWSGPAAVAHYFVDGPPGKVPRYVMADDYNQSIHAVFLRANPSLEHSWESPWFICTAICLTALAMVSWFRGHRDTLGFSGLVLLPLAVLVYPGTWTHFSALLVLPLALVALRIPPGAAAAVGAAAWSAAALDGQSHTWAVILGVFLLGSWTYSARGDRQSPLRRSGADRSRPPETEAESTADQPHTGTRLG